MDATKKITKNLGGNRLGSGSKNNISMHAYNRSTHNLSKAWRSSMNVGTLVPFLKIIGLPGDTFSIDLQSVARTVPTIGPLYGAYKLQLDVFECPIRLYNGLLHNNMTKIGLNMSQVKLPKMTLTTKVWNPERFTYDWTNSQISSSSLIHYLGIRGIGDVDNYNNNDYVSISRTFNAVPMLAYWDIYKCYYCNKQEEYGAMITHQATNAIRTVNHCNIEENEYNLTNYTTNPNTNDSNQYYQAFNENVNIEQGMQISIHGIQNMKIDELCTVIYDEINNIYYSAKVSDPLEWANMSYNTVNNEIIISNPNAGYDRMKLVGLSFNLSFITYQDSEINITKFPIENIDKARIAVLRDTGLNNEMDINNDLEQFPYVECIDNNADGNNKAWFSQQGLAIKTYQSDLLNNWLQTEWIDGVNGINTITAIDTSSGSFTVDALNLANRVYNMLNRIAVSGGSYEDYIEAVYTVEANRRAESPVYKGGMAAEIVFEEVVSSAESGNNPLGTLGGKGVIKGERGGKIEIRCDEPCYIMGIVSITPRIDYSQGNDFDMTELDTLNDLHKPALDGIGFEDLLQERAAWWGTYWDTTNSKWVKLAMGKTPAWLNYMTAVNECHGEFAEYNKKLWMTLNRQYEHDGNGSGISDLTTYIDPRKYNYTFADASLDAQNFWVQIGMKIIARRVMSAKILPNL